MGRLLKAYGKQLDLCFGSGSCGSIATFAKCALWSNLTEFWFRNLNKGFYKNMNTPQKLKVLFRIPLRCCLER